MIEIREILKDLDAEILSMKEAGISIDIEENGATFEENSQIKAEAVAKECPDAIVLADDSGLEIDYLNKEPGVYSARYMGEDTSYDIKNQALLDRLEGVPKEKPDCPFCMRHLCRSAGMRGTIYGKRYDRRIYRMGAGGRKWIWL